MPKIADLILRFSPFGDTKGDLGLNTRPVAPDSLKGVNVTRNGQSIAESPLSGFEGGYQRTLRSSREENDSNSVVYSCIRIISSTLLEPPLRVWDGERAIENHPLELLYRCPNPQISGARMWPFVVASMMLEGNAYLRIMKATNAGEPRVLMPLAPWTVTAKTSEDHQVLKWYAVNSKGRKEELEPEEVIHIPFGMDPEQPWRGEAPVRAALLEVMTDNEATRYTNSVLRNGFGAGVVAMPVDENSEIDEEDAVALKAKWAAEVGGAGRGGLLVSGLRMKVETLGFSPEQLALNMIQRVPEQRICMVFGVPSILAGTGAGLERSTYSNFETAMNAFLQFTMVPLWKHMSSEIDAKVLSLYASPKPYEARYDLKKVKGLQEEEDALHSRVGADYRNGLITRAEGRDALGYPAAPGDDVYSTSAAGVAATADAKVKGRNQRWRFEDDRP
ncbi:MAG: phage portal protein [Alphaproteobacteria bacterium]|nr:MAG: phage portal protein [Alphaproteobacteria bacterium]